MEVRMGFVYENDAGEQRLVVSVDHGRANPVAIWRTPDPNLPKGAKAQGSATVASFRRWAVKMRKATSEDWSAFQQVDVGPYFCPVRRDRREPRAHHIYLRLNPNGAEHAPFFLPNYLGN